MAKSTTSNEIDTYIASFPKPTQLRLQEIRAIIQKALPKAEEIISYKMPAYKQYAVLVYFAGYKNHIGFYPTSSGIRNFITEFSNYKWSKGAVQFPIDKPMPAKLITKISKFRLQEEKEKATKKKEIKKG